MNDLISRAELLRDLSYCAPELWQDEKYIKAKIMKQHAVDAAPVIHGRWIFHEGNGPMDVWLTCSVCGKESGVHEGNYYCHWYGAKMDGGSANETN